MEELNTPSFTLDARFTSSFEALAKMIQSAQTIALCAHTKPDGDAFGSLLALDALIKKLHPQKEVFCLLADNEEPSATFSFLDPQEHFVAPDTFAHDFLERRQEASQKKGGKLDLFIALDTPLLKRLGHAGPIALRARKVISIDHHLSRQPFADFSIVDETACATGMLVAQFLLYLQKVQDKKLLNQEIANDLFLALMTDTGRFQYQNTSVACFSLAAWLVENGADTSFLSTQIYQSDSLELIYLKARVMKRLSLHCTGLLAYSFATAEDFKELGIRPADADGLVDIVRSVEGAQIALFLKELQDPTHIRGSLRAKGDIDVSSIAAYFGGGGHRAAAGFSAEGPIKAVAAEVIELAQEVLC